MKKICVVGTGYVGLVSGVCFAEKGFNVICVDTDACKIEGLRKGIMPIYEKDLEELCIKNQQQGRIEFTTSIEYGVKNSDVIFIAVGTPSLSDGNADMKYVHAVAKDIGRYMNDYKVIVNKSTVPVGTQKEVVKLIGENQKEKIDFDVISNPEFLREGTAIADTMNMERVVIGSESERATRIMLEIHKPFNTVEVVVLPETAEIIKYASNAFLATKISFINEMACLCEAVGADVDEVAKGMGLDQRIGDKFLNAGLGYGGACFPKDTKALIKICEASGYENKIVVATEDVNKNQKKWAYNKIVSIMGDLKGKTIGVLGLAFKPGTNDMREAPSIEVIENLIRDGANVKAYDPIAMEEAKRELKGVKLCDSSLEVINGSDAVIVVTEWDEFKELSIESVLRTMKGNVIVDGRNVFDYEEIKEIKDIVYACVGKKVLAKNI